MSAKLLGTVWELALPEHQQAVLLALCDHAKPDGTDCYPSVGRVAWMTGKSDRQVQRIMGELRDADILVLERAGGGRGRPSRYRIVLDHVERKPAFVSKKGDTDDVVTDDVKGDVGDVVSQKERVTWDAGKGDMDPPERVTPMSPEPTDEPTATKRVHAPDLFSPEQPETKIKRRRRGRKPEVDIPADFTPNQKDRELADELNLDVEVECEAWIDKAAAKGWQYSDPHGGFRTWLRNARIFLDERATNGRGHRGTGPTPRVVIDGGVRLL